MIKRILVYGATFAVGAICIAASVCLVREAARETLHRSAEQVAVTWTHLLQHEIPGMAEIIYGRAPTEQELVHLQQVETVAEMFRFRLFDGRGREVLVMEGGAVEADATVRDEVALRVAQTGQLHIEVKNGVGHSDRPDMFAEAYVPLFVGSRLVGVTEIYVDVTAIHREVIDRFTEFGLSLAALFLLFLVVPTTIVVIMGRKLRARNVRLAVARDEALAAEISKSQFLANMSHEIRTPMNGVIGMTDLLEGTTLDEQQRTYTGIIANSAQALLGIINDVLEFSRLDAGGVKLEAKAVKVSRVVADPAAMVSKLAQEKGLEVLVRVDPDLPRHIVGDYGRLRQVVTNMIANAVKFTEAGQVVVDASREAGPDGDRLRVEVRDTGIGIPEAELHAVFDTFSQVDGSSTREYEGTGLGLAISRSLVELMGGRIGAESELGRGSTFWFSVPLVPAPEAPQEPEPVPGSFEGLRVLVVDDNSTNRLILQETLSSWNIDGVSAASGEEGLQALRNAHRSGRPFGIVLLDHQMPRMDGMQVLARLRADADIAATPVILLSSLETPAIGSGGVTPNARLTKPVIRSDLFDSITDCLARSRKGDAPMTGAGDPRFYPDADAPRILVVEDNRVNQMVIEALLRKIGLQFRTVANGADALAVYRDARPDLVFMDISMPGMNGYEATRGIREIEAELGGSPAHIIALTAHALEGDRQKCLEAGMDDYLTKPISASRLRDGLAASGVIPGLAA